MPAAHAESLWRWLDEHPWVMSIALVILIAVPGFIRIEAIANDAQRTADEVAQIVEDSCRDRNQVQRLDRARWVAAVDIIESFHVRAEFVAKIRSIIAAPEDEDRDCNGDHKLTQADYSGPPPPRIHIP